MPAFSKLLTLCLLGIAAARAESLLTGHVVDEDQAPVIGAQVSIHSAAAPAAGPWTAKSDAGGAFSITLPAAGDYLVDVARQGYYKVQAHPIHIETALDVTLSIHHVQEVFQSVNVDEQPSPVDVAQTTNEQRLTGTEINDVLYPNSHSLRDSLQMMPGVVLDQGGGLHPNGASENQVQYVLNGFNITDPVTNQFQSTLAVEGVHSVDYDSGRYSPEYGKGSAGVLAIKTEDGTDHFHYTATDFIPGLNLQQGLALGNWFPRVGFSGPIVRGRAWFSDTLDLEYNTALITGLPNGQNTRSGIAVNNLMHTQFNVTPRNIAYADFLVNLDYENRVGLSPLDPVSTTQTTHTHQYFGNIKDQHYLGHTLIDFGYAHNEFVDSQTPQGQLPYVFGPSGRSGNYFVTGAETASRDEGVSHVYVPKFKLAGSHQIQFGADADRLVYDGDFHRTSYELVGLSNQLLSQTSFTGSGLFAVHDTEFAAWVLDTWSISKRLQVDAGVRIDRDWLVRNSGVSPRIAASWSPFQAGHTRVAGGFAVTYDAVPLDPFGRLLDQSGLTTDYSASGVPVGPPALTSFAPPTGPLKLPRATNWSLSVDQEVTSHILATFKYLRRRGTDGFDFLNTLAPNGTPSLLPFPNGSVPGIYQLDNLRRDDFDSVQFIVRQTFSGQYEWTASYTRSSAQSNAVLDFNTLTPLQVLADLVPMPWDTPNRFLGSAYLPTPWKNWAVAILVDARTGFPFSAQQPNGLISGPVDSYRYPFNFDLDFAIERMITLRGYRFALRGGVDNLTGARNPTAVINTIGSPQYLTFLGDEGRHFVVRVRFFGRAVNK